jgi:hypothetical protein
MGHILVIIFKIGEKQLKIKATAMSTGVILTRSKVVDYCSYCNRHQERTVPEAVFLFFKLLSIVFLAYCVLQSIAEKPCYSSLRYGASENLVYKNRIPDTPVDDAIAEVDDSNFAIRRKRVHDSLSFFCVLLITLKPCRHSCLAKGTRYSPALRLCFLSDNKFI